MSIFQTISASISKIGLFWQEKSNGTIFRWNLFFLFSQLIILFIKYTDLPPQIPLFYSEPWGGAQLTTSTSIFFLPLFSFIVLVTNNFLATSFFKSIPLLSKLLVVVSLIFTLYSTIALYQIISLIS